MSFTPIQGWVKPYDHPSSAMFGKSNPVLFGRQGLEIHQIIQPLVQHTVYPRGMNLRELPKISYAIAVEHGWWEDERPLVDLIMLMVSEVSEAIEDYRKNHAPNEMWFMLTHSEGGVEMSVRGNPGDKPCGIPSELADLVIRIADTVGRLDDTSKPLPYKLSETEGDAFTLDLSAIPPLKGTFMEGLFKATSCVVRSMYEQADGTLIPQFDFRAYLRCAVLRTFALARQFDIDLVSAIELKTAYNRTRPYKHGGKKI